jgi:hypothetical protein
MPPKKKATAKGLAKPRKVTLKEKPAHILEEEWAAKRRLCAVVTVDRKRHRHASQANQAAAAAEAAAAQVCLSPGGT